MSGRVCAREVHCQYLLVPSNVWILRKSCTNYFLLMDQLSYSICNVCCAIPLLKRRWQENKNQRPSSNSGPAQAWFGHCSFFSCRLPSEQWCSTATLTKATLAHQHVPIQFPIQYQSDVQISNLLQYIHYVWYSVHTYQGSKFLLPTNDAWWRIWNDLLNFINEICMLCVESSAYGLIINLVYWFSMAF